MRALQDAPLAADSLHRTQFRIAARLVLREVCLGCRETSRGASSFVIDFAGKVAPFHL